MNNFTASTFLVLCLGVCQLSAQISMADEAAKTVIFLSSNYPLDKTTQFGSATLVKNESNEYYFVTATHVASLLTKDSYVIFQDSSGRAFPIKISEFIDKGGWVNHPIADLSVLKANLLKPKPKKGEKASVTCLSTTQIETRKQPIDRNVRLTIVGYPQALGVADFEKMSGKSLEYISPLTYHSYASSKFLTIPRADTKTNQVFIILENPSTQGYSGGPVFDLGDPRVGNADSGIAVTNPKILLVGFIHGTESDTTGGKMTMMTPAYYLWDLIKR
jgi:hypothetical protein